MEAWLIRTDPLVQSRFWTFEMTRWREDDELRSLLAAIGTVLPPRRPSALHGPVVVKLLLAHSGGVTRDLFRIVVHAAEAAVRSGAERIAPENARLRRGEEGGRAQAGVVEDLADELVNGRGLGIVLRQHRADAEAHEAAEQEADA